MLGIYSPISVVPFFQLHFKSFAADPLISRYQILQLYHCKSKVKFLGIIQVIFFLQRTLYSHRIWCILFLEYWKCFPLIFYKQNDFSFWPYFVQYCFIMFMKTHYNLVKANFMINREEKRGAYLSKNSKIAIPSVCQSHHRQP